MTETKKIVSYTPPDLEEGIYELSEDVVNPHPHKRRNAWIYDCPSAFPGWKKGTRFFVKRLTWRNHEGEMRVFPLMRETYEYLSWAPGQPVNPENEHHFDRCVAILPKLVKLQGTKTFHEAMRLNQPQRIERFDDILALLVEQKKLTLDDIRAAHEKLESFTDEDEKAFAARNGMVGRS